MTSRAAVRVCSLVALGGAALLAPRARVQVSVDAVDMGPLLTSAGAWKCVEVLEPRVGQKGAAASQECTYRNKAGVEVRAMYVVTATRLGALRDYAIPFEVDGWVRRESVVASGPHIEPLGEAMRYRLDTFHQDGREFVACLWFVSPGRQADDLASAEIRGWTDLLLHGDPPVWVEVFARAMVDEDVEETRGAVRSFAEAAGPMLGELAGRGVPDPP